MEKLQPKYTINAFLPILAKMALRQKLFPIQSAFTAGLYVCVEQHYL